MAKGSRGNLNLRQASWKLQLFANCRIRVDLAETGSETQLVTEVSAGVWGLHPAGTELEAEEQRGLQGLGELPWGGVKDTSKSRSRSSALLPTFFGWEGSPTKIDYRKKNGPYSNLSTGGGRN